MYLYVFICDPLGLVFSLGPVWERSLFITLNMYLYQCLQFIDWLRGFQKRTRFADARGN